MADDYLNARPKVTCNNLWNCFRTLRFQSNVANELVWILRTLSNNFNTFSVIYKISSARRKIITGINLSLRLVIYLTTYTHVLFFNLSDSIETARIENGDNSLKVWKLKRKVKTLWVAKFYVFIFIDVIYKYTI